MGAGTEIERRAVDRILDSAWFEGFLADALNSERVQAALTRALESEGADRLVATLLDSGLVDEVVDRLIAAGALRRLLGEALDAGDVEQIVARAFEQGLIGGVVDRLAMEPALWRLVDEIAASPAVNAAVTQQSLSFADQVGTEVRRRSQAADELIEARARRWSRRRGARAHRDRDRKGEERSPVRYVGLLTRGLAFAIDAALINLVAIVVQAGVGFVLSLVHLPDTLRHFLVGVGAVVYTLWAIAYFVLFWSTTGQTPGARVMMFRVRTAAGERVTTRRAVVRWIGLIIAALPLFAGYLLIPFSSRRRGLHDQLAGTVVEAAPLSVAQQRRLRVEVSRPQRMGAGGSSHPGDEAAASAPHPERERDDVARLG